MFRQEENIYNRVFGSILATFLWIANFIFDMVGKKSAKIKIFKKKISLARRTFQLFKNPLGIIFTGSSLPLTDLYLRNGLVFRVAKKDVAIPSIAEVWWHRVYGNLDHLKGVSSPVIIDIGAHVGSFTLLALNTFPTASLYSFEPDPVGYACLVENVRLNHFASRCVAVNKAVCGDSAPRTFYVRSENSPSNGLFPPRNAAVSSQVSVACTTLADILNDYHILACDLLKIDAQIAEYEIVLKTPERYFRKIRSIILEYHIINLPNYKPEMLFGFLRRQGYEITFNEAARVLTAIRP